MECWYCRCDNAEYTYEYDLFYRRDRLTKSISKREDLRYIQLRNANKEGFESEPRSRYYCKKCLDEHRKTLEERRTAYAKLKKKLMLERAVRILEKQALDIYEYRDIIRDFEEYVDEYPEKFDSAHEMIAAIILVDNAIKAKMQYKIESYRVDFLIPEMKVVLEIDGTFHKYNLYRDNKRDIRIREKLGADWEVVRIGTNYIEQNAKALVRAIEEIKKEKQKIRSQNAGMLPEWYSERNKAKRSRSIKVGDDDLLGIL